MTEAARITDAMAQLTAARAATFLDTCRITRPADPGQTPVLDADGNVAAPADTVVYDGPCSLAPYKSSGVRSTTKLTTDDDDAVPEPLGLRLPLTADARIGDLAEMTSCLFAPPLVGAKLRVLHENDRSYATYRSMTVRGFSWSG